MENGTAIISHVAVVSADSELRERWVQGLGHSAEREPPSRSASAFRFLPQDSTTGVLDLARADGRLQSVIIDTASIDDAPVLVGALKQLRPELDLFLAVAPGTAMPDLPAGLLDRDDDKPSHLLRQVQTAIELRARTPFADTLRDYVYSARDAWHTPGHSGGDSLRGSAWVTSFYQMMGEHIFNTDLSVSVQELDSLLEPHSVIQASQDLAATAFGADHTFFVTNGTSTPTK